MSKTIDERVVSMQFDNKQFERNVATSMSTLEKLKHSLNLNGAAKGLQEINTTSKNINMTGLSNAVQTVTNKFSALQVMGVTALANISNQAVNAGKRIMNSLTIQPITTGFNEYELKMDSVRTIMASTGESVETVNKYLNELNEYSDQTIYSFSDMTQNIGKFTNAGVKLEDAVLAIKGISNEAAISGANANEAARAMYNFAQALSAGHVKLIDWKSIENANMATVEFKQQLIDTGIELGTVTKEADGMYKTLDGNLFNATQNFNEVLNDQWMTSEVLVETLKDYADETTDIGKKAKAAAQDVTKFSQVFDILKETAQSGWARTWELIFGDIEQAKALFTPLTNFLTGIMDKISDARNNLLEGALGKTFTDMFGNINKVLDKTSKSLDKITKPAKDAENALKDLSIVDEVWAGKWDTWKVRFDKLTDAGYNYCRVQNEINERKGVSFRYTEEEIKTQDKLLGRLEDTTEQTKDQTKETDKLTKADKRLIKSLAKQSDEWLRVKGYTDDQIKSLRELEEQAKRLGIPFDEFIDKLDEINGRWILIDSFKNIGEALVQVFTIIGQAWKDAFGFTDEEKQEKLFNLIEKFHAFTEALILSEDAAKRFKTIMDGVMAVLDISWAVFSGSLVATIKLASAVLGLFGTNLAEVAEYIANLIIKFRDWVKENTMFIGMTDKLAKVIHAILSGVKRLFDAFTSLNIIGDAASKIWKKITDIFGKFNLKFDGFGIDGVLSVINSFFDNAENWIKKLDKIEGFRDFINGIVNIFTSGADSVVNAISGFFDKIKSWFKNLKWDEIFGLGDATSGMPFIDKIITGLLKGASFLIDAVQTIFTGMIDFVKNFSFSSLLESGKDIVLTLGKGIEMSAPHLWNLIKNVGAKIVEIFEKLDLGTILAGLVGFLTTKGFTRVLDVIEKFANPLDKLGGMFENIGKIGPAFCDTLNAVKGAIKGFSLNLKAKAIKEIAIAIGILAASIAVLALLPAEDVKSAMSVILIIMAAMAGLVVLIGMFGKVSSGLGDTVKGMANIAKASGLILAVSLALLMIAGVAKMVAGIKWADLGKAGALMAGFGVLVAALLWATKLADEKTIKDASKVITRVSIALLLLSFTAKLIAGMTWGELGKAGAGLGGLFLIILMLTKISGKAGSGIEHAGKTIRQIATAMLLLTIVAKIIANMEWSEMGKAAVGLMGLVGIVAGLAAATKLAGGQRKLENASKMMSSIGACMILLAIVAKIISTMSWEELGKAAVGLVGLGGIVTGLIAATRLAGGGAKLKGVSKTLIAMSLCIGILAGVAIVLGFVDLSSLAKGVIAVGILGAIMAMLVHSTKGTKDVSGNLTRMIIAIGLLAVIVVVLSNIEDTSSLLIAVGSMTTLMFALSSLIKSTKSLSKVNTKPLLAIIGVAAALGLILIAMSHWTDPEALIPSALSLSILMLAFASSLRIIARGGSVSKTVAAQILPMLGVTAGLGLILIAMSKWSNPTALVSSAVALSILLTALVTSLVILSKAGPMATNAIYPAMLMGLVAGELAIVLGILSNNVSNVDALIPTAVSLSVLLLALSAACIILGGVGIIGSAALIGAGVFIGVVAILGALAIAIGEVMTLIPQEKIEQWQTGIERFTDLLTSLASGLGEAIGAFIGGIAMGVLEGVGQGLSNFMSNAQGFIDGARKVDGDVLAGVGVLAAAIVALTATSFINGISQFSPLASSFASMGTQLSDFMVNAQGFIEGAGNIKPEMIEGVDALSRAILTLTAANLLEGIGRLFGMESSLADFGTELKGLGEGMKAYSDAVGDIDNEAVTSSANAAKTLAEMANTIPNEGGLLGKLLGENSVDTFGTQLESLGASLKAYSVAVTGINLVAVTLSVQAAKSLSNMAEAIPNFGGLVSFFTGDNDLATFGSQLTSFGWSLKSYGIAVTGLAVESITASVQAANSLSKMADSLPNYGGLVSFFTGDNDISMFGMKLMAFGNALKNYSISVIGLDTASIATSVMAAKWLAKLAEALPTDGGLFSWAKDDTMDMGTFGRKITNFGKAMQDYSLAVADIDATAVSSSITNAKRILAFMNSLVDFDGSGVSAFKGAMLELGGISVQSFISAFTDASSQLVDIGAGMLDSIISGIVSKQPVFNSESHASVAAAMVDMLAATVMFGQVGLEIISTVVKGIQSSAGNLKLAVVSAIAFAVASVRNYYNSFYSAGAYCAQGLANGIRANAHLAASAGGALAAAALAAAMRMLAIASPSKEFYNIGDFAGQGFVNALTEYEDASYKSASAMAGSAMNGLSDTISKIKNAIDSDIDVNPTIRPVLDLSNVQNGANSINSMFANRTLALAGINADHANINSAASITDAIASIQKSNDDSNRSVVAAITNLRGDFGSLVEAIGNMHIRMDSGTVVGELIGKIDSGLGRIATHKGRGI